jgi:CubicO group peptidase (beta-lactamase class C family)
MAAADADKSLTAKNTAGTAAEHTTQTPSGISFLSLESEIDKYVQNYIGVTSPGAAVVVVSEGEIVFSKGYGFSDIKKDQPVDPEQTIFEYGSVSKLFVYNSLMQLSEKGQLDLDDDIRSYLPDGFLKKLRYDDPVTFINIMNHQAGFEDVLFDTVITDPVQKAGFLETLKASQPEQVYKPGTVSAYSNYAVALAAYSAQRLLGQDFHSHLRESVFDTLAMNSTSAHPDLADRPELKSRRARGYVQNADGSFREEDWSYIPLYPVGAVSGTAEDLARFAMALLPPVNESGPLFSKRNTLDEMLSQTMSMGPGLTGFAHGFIEKDGAYRALGHGGNTAAFTAQLNIVPEKRFGVIVLANAASEMNLTEGITRLLLDGANQSPEPEPVIENLPDSSALNGSYVAARRPHNGFLRLYGFLNLLKVESMDNDNIRVSYAGQHADYVQSEPYLFEQTTFDGSIFEFNFQKICFEVENGSVVRISGDFLPLPAGFSLSWLRIDIIIAVLAVLVFLIISPLWLLILIIIKIRNRTRDNKNDFSGTDRQPAIFMLIGGAGLLINSGILVLRMLQDNYRAFSEVRLQLILNFPFALLGLAGIFLIFKRPADNSGKALNNRIIIRRFIVLLMLLGLYYLMFKWQFYYLPWI